MQPRTKRQKEVLEFITRYVTKHGYKPSYQQIARQLGVTSKSGIARHIQALENQGLLSRRRENGSFGLELASNSVAGESVCKIEFLEVVHVDGAASDWITLDIAIPKIIIGSLPPDEVFAFRTQDDSMIDKHILESDIVLLERRSYARRGDVVVAVADGKQMLFGQFFHIGTETEIRPANTYYEAVTFAADRVVVRGVMRALLRPMASRDH